jgi:type I restriction enzyme, S subunit
MSEKWPLVVLGELLVQSEETVEVELDKKYKRVTVRLWGQGAVLRDEVDGTEIATKRQYVVRSRQFIMSRIDARHGASAIVPDYLDGAIVSNDFPTFNVSQSRVFPDYLGWLSKTQSFVALCKAASEGTTNRVRLKVGHFLNTKIPLPPLDEQRRIVAHIEELAAKIEQARVLRRQAMEEVNALVTSLHLKIATHTTTIDEFLTLSEKREEVSPNKKYPQIGIRGFGQGLFGKEAVDATQTTYRWFNRLFEGAIVLSQVKGWEGAIGVCPPDLVDYYASPEYRTFRCIKEKVLPEYLAVLLATPWFWTQLEQLNRGLGGRRQRTRPEQFLRLEIPMPPVKQQRKALQVFEKLKPIKQHQMATTVRLEALLPSVLDRVFSGK